MQCKIIRNKWELIWMTAFTEDLMEAFAHALTAWISAKFHCNVMFNYVLKYDFRVAHARRNTYIIMHKHVLIEIFAHKHQYLFVLPVAAQSFHSIPWGSHLRHYLFLFTYCWTSELNVSLFWKQVKSYRLFHCIPFPAFNSMETRRQRGNVKRRDYFYAFLQTFLFNIHIKLRFREAGNS